MRWQTTRFEIDLSRPRVMGIVNVTPDSFSDGGHLQSAIAALVHCERLVSEGADILDIGGESSRPGAESVSVQQELDRVMPVLEGALALGVPLSIDTVKPEVMRAAVRLGADIVNDIQALRAPGAVEAVAETGCGVCLMHMRGEPSNMQTQAHYDDVVAEVIDFLSERLVVLQANGVKLQRVALDLTLLQRQRDLLALGRPLLLGWSRKSTLGAITGRDVAGRLPASLAAALAAVQQGAHIIRVHDVAATVDALKVWRAAGLCQ
jgi:dihydropteroate synthase